MSSTASFGNLPSTGCRLIEGLTLPELEQKRDALQAEIFDRQFQILDILKRIAILKPGSLASYVSGPPPLPPIKSHEGFLDSQDILIGTTFFTGSLCFAAGISSFFRLQSSNNNDRSSNALDDHDRPATNQIDSILNVGFPLISGSLILISMLLLRENRKAYRLQQASLFASSHWLLFGSCLITVSYSTLSVWSLWRIIRNTETHTQQSLSLLKRFARSFLSPEGALFLYSSAGTVVHMYVSYAVSLLTYFLG